VRVYSNSRDKILAAAEALVIDQGAGKLTLDAVAKRAGISKGGLIHNFATKEALLAAMIEQMLHTFQKHLADETKDAPKTSHGNFITELRLSLQLDAKFMKVSAALLAAASAEPKLLAPVQDWYKQHYKNLSSGDLDFPEAAILSLASDGIYLLSLLGLLQLTESQKKQIVQTILKKAENCKK